MSADRTAVFAAALLLGLSSHAHAQISYSNTIRQLGVSIGGTSDGASSTATGPFSGTIQTGTRPNTDNSIAYTSSIAPGGIALNADITVWSVPPAGSGLPAALVAFGTTITITTPVTANIVSADSLTNWASVNLSLTGGGVNISGRTLNQTVTLAPGTYTFSYSLAYNQTALPAAGPVSFAITFGPAGPSPTAITYQGSLRASGLPASGLYDLEATLYDSATGGSVVGGPVPAPSVAVSGGLFTVDLDFGLFATATNALRFMEVRIRPAGGAGAWTTLAPRTRLAPAPRALYADQAGVASTAGTASTASFATVAQSTLDVNIAGRGTLRGEAGASPLSPGLVLASPPDAPISRAFVGMADDNNIGFFGYGGASWIMTARTDSGAVGIGTLDPAAKLDVIGDIRASAYRYAADQIRTTTVAFPQFVAVSGEPVSMLPLVNGVGGPDGTNTALIAHAHLPAGSIILDATAFYRDADATGDLSMDILVFNPEVPNFSSVGSNLPLAAFSDAPKTAMFNFPTGAPVSADRPVLIRVYPVGGLWGPGNNKTIQAVKIRSTVTRPD